MDNYIIRNLKRYGNTVINQNNYQDNILEELKKYGLNCTIRAIDDKKEVYHDIKPNKRKIKIAYILEVIKE